MLRFCLIQLSLLICFVKVASGIAKYDEGRLEINGIQLFQDSENSNAYYYVPPYPRISVLDNGDFEFLCTKYVGVNGKESSGGLFHVLVQFSLSKEELRDLEKKLKEKFPKAMIMGPVPMAEDEDRKDASGFRIVSTLLNTQSDNRFTTNLISSGRAPFLPGSKAAIAAHLTPDGATLLWDSFSGTTSDVSIVVEGFFRAKVKAYKATVRANLELVYNHFSTFKNVQSGFTRDQATEVLDSLCQSGMIEIDVADLSAGLDVKTDAYQNILNIITEKVVSQMFDVNSGWAKMPARESAAQPSDLKERYQRGAFVRFFAGDGSQEYIPDDQLVLKKRTDIRSFHFFLDLNQSTVIKVPVYSAGNIRGFYNEYKDDKRYFRVVDMNDPDFQLREIHFQVDGSFIPSFGEIIDQVSVLVQKDYPGESSHSYTGTLLFSKPVIDSGKVIQSLSYQRLGDRTEDWLSYKYKVGWKFIGVDSLITTPEKDWVKANLSSVSLQPPLSRTDIEIGIDKQLLEQQGIQSVRIRFASILFKKPYKGKAVVIRASDANEALKATVYHDKDQPVVYQINWYTNKATLQDDLKVLDDDYLFLVPPKIK
jgi:hypothetical protein